MHADEKGGVTLVAGFPAVRFWRLDRIPINPVSHGGVAIVINMFFPGFVRCAKLRS